jgi:pimeloyl-ACP methyl ester carboxylesterase
MLADRRRGCPLPRSGENGYSRVMPGRPFQRGPFAQLPATPRRPHRYYQSRAREITLAGSSLGPLRVHYREAGDGPPLLLVHGLMTSSYSFRYVIDELARDFRVIVPDLPGAGRSAPPQARLTGAALATFLVELTRALGIYGCPVVGNSMGGYLCMRAALTDPRAFSRIVNVHSPAGADWRHHAMHALLSLPGAQALLARFVRLSPHRWVHRNVHYYDESLKSLEEAAEYGDPLATPEGVRAFVGYLYDTFAPRDLEGFLAELTERRDAGRPFPVPLLLLYSRQDPLVPPRVGDQLHALVPDAPLEWLEDTSHFAHVDTPELVLPHLRSFLGVAAAAAG